MEESQQIVELLAEADAYGRKEKVLELVSNLKETGEYTETPEVRLYEMAYEIEVSMYNTLNDFLKI